MRCTDLDDQKNVTPEPRRRRRAAAQEKALEELRKLEQAEETADNPPPAAEDDGFIDAQEDSGIQPPPPVFDTENWVAEEDEEIIEKRGGKGPLIFLIILLVTALLKTALKNKYVQAILRGLKPCVIGIVLATGIYMVLGNCFGTISAITINMQAIIITALLAASMFGYKHFAKKKLSPIGLILLSAIFGIIIF